jgi:KDO2-lipid IV(A) lauroyltransferase
LGILDRLGLALASALVFPVAMLPKSALRRLSRLVGRLVFLLFKKRRLIAVRNIEMAKESGFLPEELDSTKTAKAAFENLAHTIGEAMCLHARGFKPFEKSFRIEGAERVTEAKARSRETGAGILFLTAHMGNWELLPHAVSRTLDIKVAVVGRRQGSKILDRMIEKVRTGPGTSFIFKDGGAREMLTVLRGGGALGTLVDQAAMVGRESVPLSFMGRLAYTNVGPFKLGQRTGAIMIPLFCRREGDLHVFEIKEPIYPGDEPRDEAFSLRTAQLLNDILGETVKKHPAEWLWCHRRFKTPGGAKNDPYQF